MNPLTVDELDHVVVLVEGEDFLTTNQLYRAECSCGWASVWTDDPADADDARADHLEVVW